MFYFEFTTRALSVGSLRNHKKTVGPFAILHEAESYRDFIRFTYGQALTSLTDPRQRDEPALQQIRILARR